MEIANSAQMVQVCPSHLISNSNWFENIQLLSTIVQRRVFIGWLHFPPSHYADDDVYNLPCLSIPKCASHYQKPTPTTWTSWLYHRQCHHYLLVTYQGNSHCCKLILPYKTTHNILCAGIYNIEGDTKWNWLQVVSFRPHVYIQSPTHCDSQFHLIGNILPVHF